MKKQLLIFAIALTLLNACTKSVLKETIFEEDPDYPGLPVHSNMGYNTFGAYFNDKVFSIETYGSDRPFYIVADREGLDISLSGNLQGQGGHVNLTFNLPVDENCTIGTYHDLSFLDSLTFSIDTIPFTCQIEITGDTATEIQSVYGGHVSFDAVKQVIVDKENAELVLSGKFQFRVFTTNGTRLDVTGGRFDLGVDATNFVNFRQ